MTAQKESYFKCERNHFDICWSKVSKKCITKSNCADRVGQPFTLTFILKHK